LVFVRFSGHERGTEIVPVLGIRDAGNGQPAVRHWGLLGVDLALGLVQPESDFLEACLKKEKRWLHCIRVRAQKTVILVPEVFAGRMPFVQLLENGSCPEAEEQR
jgi:hypothetical protein